MNEKQNLEALLQRLSDEQRRLIVQPAELALLPADNALRKIADLELAISAVEHTIDGIEGRSAVSGPNVR